MLLLHTTPKDRRDGVTLHDSGGIPGGVCGLGSAEVRVELMLLLLLLLLLLLMLMLLLLCRVSMLVVAATIF